MGSESNDEKETSSKRNAEGDSTQTAEEMYREKEDPSTDGDRDVVMQPQAKELLEPPDRVQEGFYFRVCGESTVMPAS